MTEHIKEEDKEALELIFEALSREQLYWLSERSAQVAKEKDDLWKQFGEEFNIEK